MAVGRVQPHAGSCQQLFCFLGSMLGSFLLSWRLWEHLVLSQAAGAKQPLLSLAGQASLQAPLQRGPTPPCHLFISVIYCYKPAHPEPSFPQLVGVKVPRLLVD